MNIDVFISYTDDNGVTYDCQSSVQNQDPTMPVLESIIMQIRSALAGQGYTEHQIDRYIGDPNE